MTILSPETLKAIEAHKKAQRFAERMERLAERQRQQQAYQMRAMVNDGYGWEDLVAELKVSRDEAKTAVFRRRK